MEEFHDGKGPGELSNGNCLKTKLRKAIVLEGVSSGQLCGRQLFRGKLFKDNCPGQKVMGTCPGRFPGRRIVREVVARRKLFRKECPGVKNPRGTCPGGNFMGNIVRGVYPAGSCSGVTIWGKFHRGQLSWGELPRGE